MKVLQTVKSYISDIIKKKKQPKTREQLIKDVIAYSITVVVLFILAVSFKPKFAWAENPDDYDMVNPLTQTTVTDAMKDAGIDENAIVYGANPDADGSKGSAFMSGHVIDEIVNGLLEKVIGGCQVAVEFIVRLMTKAFEPTLSPLVNLEAGKNIELNTINEYAKEIKTPSQHLPASETMENSIIMGTIWTFASYFGYITAVLLALFNLFLCVFGKSQEIKDTPAGIGFKFALALLLITLSKYFMVGFINLYGDIWNEVIIKNPIVSTMSGNDLVSALMPVKQVHISDGTYALVIFGSLAVSGTVLATATVIAPLLSLIYLIILIVGFVLAFKLLSECLKLFLEIVERYFVFFILIAFFPAIASTITTNNTKKIFYAYIKMVYTQGFLLIVNSVFMAIFFTVLLMGGWTAGFLNYLAALAFLRVCQRVDAYMAQMGLNVVQTGSGLAGAIGGAGLGLLSAMRGASMLNKGRQNIGGGIRDLGIKTNNSGLAKMGSIVGASGRQIVGGGLSKEGLSQSIIRDQATHIAEGQGGNGAGRIGGIEGNNWDAVEKSMANFGMSSEQAHMARENLESAGYKASDVRSIMQNDDNASSFTLADANGNAFATTDVEGVSALDRDEFRSASAEMEAISGNAEENGASFTRGVPQGFSEAIDEYAASSGVTQDMYRETFAEEASTYGAGASLSDNSSYGESTGSGSGNSYSSSGSGSQDSGDSSGDNSGNSRTSSTNTQENNYSSSNNSSTSSSHSSTSSALSENDDYRPKRETYIPSSSRGKAGEYSATDSYVDAHGRNVTVTHDVRLKANHSELSGNKDWTSTKMVLDGKKQSVFVRTTKNGKVVKNTPQSPNSGRRSRK